MSKILEQSIVNIQYEFNRMDKKIEKLEEENKLLKQENYKDNELKMMAEKVEAAEKKAEQYWKESRFGFPMTKEERDAVRDWKIKHDKKVHNNPRGYHGVSGGGYIYKFYPTGIGTLGSCICGICHKRALNFAIEETNTYDNLKYQQYMKEHNGEFVFQELD